MIRTVNISTFHDLTDFGSYHLVSQKEDSLEAEFSGAEVEKVLQTGTKQLHHHHIVVSLSATPFYWRNTH